MGLNGVPSGYFNMQIKYKWAMFSSYVRLPKGSKRYSPSHSHGFSSGFRKSMIIRQSPYLSVGSSLPVVSLIQGKNVSKCFFNPSEKHIRPPSLSELVRARVGVRLKTSTCICIYIIFQTFPNHLRQCIVFSRMKKTLTIT